MPLVPDADVRGLLPGYDVPDPQLASANKLVAGWVREDTGLGTLPDPIPDTDALYAPALELLVLAVTNPEVLASKTVGPTDRKWPVARRIDAIRRGLKARSQQAGSEPSGDFPDPFPWPDGPVFPAGGWTTVR